MGARIPPNERPRRGGIKCEFCGRPVPSAKALHGHQAILHPRALKAKIKLLAQKTSKVQKPEPRKVNLKKVQPKAEEDSKTPQKKLSSDQIISKTTTANPKTDAVNIKADSSKSKTDNTTLKVAKSVTKLEKEIPKFPAMEGKKKAANSTPGKRRKVEYKCPKCEKLFPVLFVAQKHIQKHHCVNSKDKKVAENSPDIIQPILLELCIYCDKQFSKPHNCPNRPDVFAMSFDCLGCQQRYSNNRLFDLHVANVHGDWLESLFFPSEEEFETWKKEMESQTACKYVLMGKYNSKQIYQCSEYTDSDTNTLLLCPSSFIVKMFPKGLQIHFYPCHYQHDHNKYQLKDQYKTFTITDLINQAGYANGSSDDDLYLQFKSLMESIVLDAAKINIDMLKTLMSKAKDMESILKNYDEDEEVETVKDRSTISLSTSNTSVREDSDSQPLESLQTRSRKRGLEENAAKKLRKTSDAKILVKSIGKKSFSLADDKDSDKILDELDSQASKETKTTQSPSFNDTYKDFIMNASKTVTTGKKKNVVKTKMGQFKGPSPKKVVKRDSIGSTKDIKYEVRERDEDCNILVLKI